MLGAGKKSDRRELDFYPTPPDCTHSFMAFMREQGYFLNPITILEPCAGDGAMSKVLESCGHNVTSTDLRTEDIYGKGGVDFLQMAPDFFNQYGAVITNPPFNISEKIIKHAFRFAPIVAMVLKSQYWHAKSRYHFFMKNPPAYVLPLTFRPDFFVNGKSGTMEFIWTVWIDGVSQTRYIPIKKTKTNMVLF